jgi:hypothetical protein
MVGRRAGDQPVCWADAGEAANELGRGRAPNGRQVRRPPALAAHALTSAPTDT